MATILALAFFASLISLILGLARPVMFSRFGSRFAKRKTIAIVFGILSLVTFIGFGFASPTNPQNSTITSKHNPASTAATESTVSAENNIHILGQVTKKSGCQIANSSQDIACTPGSVFDGAGKDQICVSGYSSSVRDVPESEKNAVYAEYGITSHTTGQYEVDHLISLELGGSNDISNLWPEPSDPTPGFHQKDEVENYLHDQVCSGKIQLGDAQNEIVQNWLAVYAILHPVPAPAPAPKPAPMPAPAAAPTTVQQPTTQTGNGATALCVDGTYSYSATHQGTCSHHGGVSVWYK